MQPDHSLPPSQPALPEIPVVKQTVEAREGSAIHGVTQILQVFWGNRAREAARNRQKMIECVKKIWVQDILEASIPKQAELELQVEYRAELVEKPWEVLQQPTRATDAVSKRMGVIEAYEKAGGNLLILGEAGAGKTTTLLQLARHALTIAQEDLQKPIPVVFHLSSWSPSPRSAQLERWLVQELRVRYYIPYKVARQWVENDELLFLLDGLDEVKGEDRAECVAAINAFRQSHGHASLVVCCRTQDYSELPERLMLQGAVILQPPTEVQVEQILGSARKGVEIDTVLQDFLQSPLNLEIMRRVSIENTAFDLTATSLSPEERQQRLWATYVQAMLERLRMRRLSASQAERLLPILSWLARQMAAHGQTMFYMDQIQPSWLEERRHQLAYAVGIRLVIGLLIGSVTGVIFSLAESPEVVLGIGLITGASAILASVLASRIPYWLAILSASLVTALLARIHFSPPGAVLVGLLFGTMTGLAGVSVDNISVAERLHWSWRRVTLILLSLFLTATLLGLGLALKWELERQVYTLVQMALNAVPVVLAFMLSLSRSRQIDAPPLPNQGFRRSAQNALLVGAMVMSASLLCGMMIGVVENRLDDLPLLSGANLLIGLRLGALLGLIFGISSALYVGGTACLQHLVLRLVMMLTQTAPWNLIEFLDLATERVLLQRAGGGHLFIHRQLMEYFIQVSQGENHGP